MIDPSSISGAISAVTQAISLAGQLREIDKNIITAELKMTLADLSSSLANAKLAMIDLQSELKQKDEEIDRLKKSLVEKSKTIVVDGFYYRDNGEGEAVGWPFCQVCLQEDGHFYQLTTAYAGKRVIRCPKCERQFGDAIYRRTAKEQAELDAASKNRGSSRRA